MRRLTQLHERTRRRIGLSGFVLLCLLPTIGMFTWGVSRHFPAEEAAMEERLSELFGLKVTVRSVDHPEPGVVRLRDLVLRHPDLTVASSDTKSSASTISAVPIARLASLEIQQSRRPDPSKQRKPGSPLPLCDTICMTGIDLEIARADLPEFARLVREAVGYRLSSVKKNVAISVDRLQLLETLEETFGEALDELADEETPEPLAELSDVQFKLLALDDGPQAVFDFRLVGKEEDDASQPIRFRVGQKIGDDLQAESPARLWLDLNTQAERVPCSLLGMMIPMFDAFGPEAQFSGYFCASPLPDDGWKGIIAKQGTSTEPYVPARLFNVDLETLVAHPFSQIFSGQVDVTIEEGFFQAGRLEQLRGNIVSTEPGMIGQPLLAAAAKELGMRVDTFKATRAVVPYEQFAVRFALNEEGILIEGVYPGRTGQRPILLDDNSSTNRGAILWESGKLADIGALLRTLAPKPDGYIPTGRNIQSLAERLPANK